MTEYILEIKQLVEYPRCRIYRPFIKSLIEDKNIRLNGQSYLYYMMVLYSYTNFRTSYRRIEGFSYIVGPGEWVCLLSELKDWFRLRNNHQVIDILDDLQKRDYISYSLLGREKVIKFKIRDWGHHNIVLEYNSECPKDIGFFFFPVALAKDLISIGKCSEMDIILDLWLNTIYMDSQVQGSEIGPVVYFRNGTGRPTVNYTELAARWGISRSSVSRVFKKLTAYEYLTLQSFPGSQGSVIYLNNYLSTMFNVSDILIDKEEIELCFKVNLSLNKQAENSPKLLNEPLISVSNDPNSVSKPYIRQLLSKVRQPLPHKELPVVSGKNLSIIYIFYQTGKRIFLNIY